MTQIKYTMNGDTVRISVYGHALFNPGNDVVCAGISTLTYQLLNVLVDLSNREMITDFTYDVNDGSTIVQFHLIPEAFEEWDIIQKVILIGYANMEAAYPESVHIDW